MEFLNKISPMIPECMEVGSSYLPKGSTSQKICNSWPEVCKIGPRIQAQPLPRPPNVALLRALWSLLVGIWGLLKGILGGAGMELRLSSHLWYGLWDLLAPWLDRPRVTSSPAARTLHIMRSI